MSDSNSEISQSTIRWPSSEINLPFITADASGPKHLVRNLTRAKLESLVDDLLQRSIGPSKQALKVPPTPAYELNIPPVPVIDAADPTGSMARMLEYLHTISETLSVLQQNGLVLAKPLPELPVMDNADPMGSLAAYLKYQEALCETVDLVKQSQLTPPKQPTGKPADLRRTSDEGDPSPPASSPTDLCMQPTPQAFEVYRPEASPVNLGARSGRWPHAIGLVIVLALSGWLYHGYLSRYTETPPVQKPTVLEAVDEWRQAVLSNDVDRLANVMGLISTAIF